MSQPRLPNRYRLVGTLGEGGTGSVFRAHDRLLGRDVAIKVFEAETPAAPGAPSLARDEFRLLASHAHPGFVRALDFGFAAGGRPFFSMELVEGRDLGAFAEGLLPSGTSGADRARALAADPRFEAAVRDLLDALDALHRRGLAHLDLKPANVLVRETSAAPREAFGAPRDATVTLVDFGLAGESRGASGSVGGTAEYLAPERIRGDPPGPRSDLYSLGVLLHEVLTGRCPFVGATAGETVRLHLERPVPSLDGLPERYGRVVARLLEKDPARRPASAWHARLELFGEPDGPLESWPPFEVAFVGRDDLMRRLRRTLEVPPPQGCARCVLLEGPRGVGKSRVLRELEVELELAGRAVVLESLSSGSRQPGEALTRILRAAELSASDPEGDGSPELEVLARESRELIESLEAWISGDGSADDPVEREARESRFLAGFTRNILGRAARRPLALLLDDLEGADSLCRQAVLALLRSAEHRGAEGLSAFVAVDGDQEDGRAAVAEVEATARGFSSFDRVPVGPLDEPAVDAFLRQVLGSRSYPPDLPGALVERTGGNILFVAEHLRGLAATGGMRREGAEWRLAPDAALSVPSTVEDALSRRLAALSEAARDTLAWAAVLDRPFSREELSDLGRAGPDEAGSRPEDRLDALVLDGLLQRRGAGYVISASALREVSYRALGPADRARRHGRVAERILASARAAELVEEAAHHLFLSGDPRRARPFLLKAGERARRTGALREAVVHLSRALDLTEEAAARFDVLRSRQEVLGHLGRRAEEERDTALLLEIADRLDDPARRREAALREALRLDSLGRKGEALARIEGAIATAPDGLEKARLLSRAGMIRVFLGDFEPGFAALSAAEEHARTAGDGRLVAECAQIRGLACYRQAEYDRALEELGRALVLYTDAGESHRAAAIESNIGLIHLDRGDLSAAEERFRASLKLFHRVGLRRGEAVNLLNLGLVESESGRYERALQSMLSALEIRRELGDRRAEGADLGNLGAVWLRAGQPERATAALERAIVLARELDNRQSESANQSRLGEVELARGHPERALGRFEMGLDLARRAGLPAQEVPGRTGLARSSLALGKPEDAIEQATGALELARSRRMDHKVPGLLALLSSAWRAAGDLARADACSLGAIEAFEGRAQPAADAHEIWFERYLVLEGLRAASASGSHPGPVPPEPRCADALRRAYRHLRELADAFEDPELRDGFLRNIPLHREIDRLHEELQARIRRDASSRERSFHEIARSIHAILEIDPLLGRLLSLAIETTHAEKGLIALKNPDETLTIRAARGMARESVADATDICRSVISDVARAGGAVLATDAGSDDRFRDRRSVIDFRIHTLMCVPMVVRDEIVGAVYVDGRGATSFAQEDLEYLVSFAQLAAVALDNARLLERLRAENVSLRREVETRYRSESLVGKSPPMDRLVRMIEKVAATTASILITGETGTGKEVVARAIHQASDRRSRPFVAVDCGALPENLLESELFGHRRGAFSGAVNDRIGLFEAAEGGTLFLDEITNMTLELQVKILRALQEGEVRRLGENQVRKVDVRIVAASNVDMRRAMESGRFREDLFYRLNVVSLEVPPLRKRREDIPLLAQHFLARSSARLGKPVEGFTEDALAFLMGAPWRGNVRQLENLVEKAVILADRHRLDAGFLATLLPESDRPSGPVVTDRSVLGSDAGTAPTVPSAPPATRSARWDSLEAFDREWLRAERDYLERLVRESGGNLAEAARRAKVRNRNSLISRLKKHRLGRDGSAEG